MGDKVIQPLISLRQLLLFGPKAARDVIHIKQILRIMMPPDLGKRQSFWRSKWSKLRNWATSDSASKTPTNGSSLPPRLSAWNWLTTANPAASTCAWIIGTIG